jgi:hypothetical protein
VAGGRTDLLVSAGEALADDLALEGAALVEGEVLVVLRHPRLALLVHEQHEPDRHLVLEFPPLLLGSARGSLPPLESARRDGQTQMGTPLASPAGTAGKKSSVRTVSRVQSTSCPDLFWMADAWSTQHIQRITVTCAVLCSWHTLASSSRSHDSPPRA